MQSDTDRKGIRSTRRPRLDVDIGPESSEVAIVQRSKDARGVEGVNMMPEITNRHSKPTCRIVVARTEFTGKQALLYAPPHSGNHQWRVGVAGTAGAIVREDEFWLARQRWTAKAAKSARCCFIVATSRQNCRAGVSLGD
jgi:hypothetical protein